MVTLEELADVSLIQNCLERIGDRFDQLAPNIRRRAIVHELIDIQVSHVLQSAEAFLEDSNWQDPGETFRIGPVEQLAKEKKELEAFLKSRVYHHPHLLETRKTAQQQIQTMFHGYQERVDLLPSRFQKRAENIGLARSVGDYLGSMTDRYCNQQFSQFFAN